MDKISIHEAAKFGVLEIVLDRMTPESVFEKDSKGRTPLVCAALHNNEFVAEYLYDGMDDCEEKYQELRKALKVPVIRKHFEKVFYNKLAQAVDSGAVAKVVDILNIIDSCQSLSKLRHYLTSEEGLASFIRIAVTNADEAMLKALLENCLDQVITKSTTDALFAYALCLFDSEYAKQVLSNGDIEIFCRRCKGNHLMPKLGLEP